MSLDLEGMPTKYLSRIKTAGYDGFHREQGGTLEIEFYSGLEIIVHNVPETTYEAFVSHEAGLSNYFLQIIYPCFKDEIIITKDI